MATAQSTCTAGVDLATDAAITRQDLKDAIENKTDGDFTRAHDKDDVSSIPSIGTSAPTAPPTLSKGEIWIKTLDPVDGSSTTKLHTLMTYNGTTFRPPVSWPVQGSLPTYTPQVGMMTYDSTLKCMRVYDTQNGIQGWHPINTGYQLWTNKSGTTVAANRIVVRYTATAVERAFTTTTEPKTAAVIGVTMESIGTTAGSDFGVIALVSSGAVVDIQCDTSTAGNIAMGDGICHDQVLGTGRTCDLLPNQCNAVAGKPLVGMAPYGCFAEALEAKVGGNGLVTCRLLGFVGGGLERRKAATIIAQTSDGSLADGNWAGTWQTVDVEAYPPGVGGNDFIDSDKHKPIVGVFLAVSANVESTLAGSLTAQINFGKDQSTSNAVIRNESEEAATSTNNFGDHIYVPTTVDIAPYVGPGQAFFWLGTKSSGAGVASIVSAYFRAVGYIY